MADDSLPPADLRQDMLPDTNANRIFRIASFFCAGLQFIIVIIIAISHHQPAAGGNSLEQFAGFFEVLTAIPVHIFDPFANYQPEIDLDIPGEQLASLTPIIHAIVRCSYAMFGSAAGFSIARSCAHQLPIYDDNEFGPRK